MSPKEETTSFEVILNQLVEWGNKFGCNIACNQINDKSAKTTCMHNIPKQLVTLL